MLKGGGGRPTAGLAHPYGPDAFLRNPGGQAGTWEEKSHNTWAISEITRRIEGLEATGLKSGELKISKVKEITGDVRLQPPLRAHAATQRGLRGRGRSTEP